MTALECNGLDLVKIDEKIAEYLTNTSLEYSRGYVSSVSSGAGMDRSIKITLELVFYK